MRLTFVVGPADDGERLNIFLRRCGVSAALIKRVKFLPGGISVDGVKQNTDYKVKAGQSVEVNVYDTDEDADKSTVIPQDIPMKIVYMDHCCMVVDKPCGMPVHPSFNHPTGTLANAFMGYWQKAGQPKIFRAVNRLDKNTSGLVIIALDAHTAEKLKNNVEKTYTAIVQGKVQPQHGIIELPIARQQDSIILRCVRDDGQYAKTEYEVIKQNDEYSLLDIKLHTGRTHQIRVHFSHIGHALAGDDLYGGNCKEIGRHALHCRKLEFVSCENNQKITVTSEIPQDMADIVIKI